MNQTAQTYLKQLTNVKLSLDPGPIHVLDESVVHRFRARGEVDRGFDTEKFPDIRAIEVVCDHFDLLVAQFTFAWLRFPGQRGDRPKDYHGRVTLDISYTFRPIRDLVRRGHRPLSAFPHQLPRKLNQFVCRKGRGQLRNRWCQIHQCSCAEWQRGSEGADQNRHVNSPP
jgi:hypothetical protein